MNTPPESGGSKGPSARSDEGVGTTTTMVDGGAIARDSTDGVDSALIDARIRRKVAERLFGAKPVASRIGRFLVLEELGRGGMGVVYSAYDERLDRKVAIKLLLDERSDEEARRRFQREGQAMARVSHPNVVTVHEVGEADDDVFLAMEFIRGQSFSQWLRTAPAWPEVVDAFIRAGDGLVAAHHAGLVHRDLKPHNIMLGDDGVVKVLDFGLARAVLEAGAGDTSESSMDRDSSAESALRPITRTGTVMGTPAYMSPEQFQGLPVDVRSDQFSFCVALYEALYGERPYAGQTLEALAVSMSTREVRAAPKGRKVPLALRKVLLRGLEFEPGDRWPSMEALLAPLRTQVSPRRRGWIAPVAVMGVLGVALGIGLDRYAEWSERCTGATSHLENTWDEATRQEVRAAILETEVSYAPETWARVERRLDDYAARWVGAHTEACEATAIRREQSEHHLGLRMGCLEKRRQHLQATVEELARVDETTVEHAVDAIWGMPELSRCADVSALSAEIPPPEDPAVAERVVALERRLVEIEAKQDAGRHEEGLSMIESVLVEASELDYEPLMARVWLRAGLLRMDGGDFEDAVTLLEKAYDAAMARRLTAVAAESSAVLTELVGKTLARYADAHRWALDADPLSRAVQRDEARAHYLQSRGHLALAEGQHPQAYDLMREARELLERGRGPDDLLVAKAIFKQGGVAYVQGEYDVALESYERARTIWQEALGPEHPRLGSVWRDLGNVAFKKGDYARARAHFERALVIHEGSLGVDHPETARTVNALGTLLELDGKFDEARDHYRRALASWTQAFGPEHPDVAGALTSLGVLCFSERRFEQAREPLERALAIREALYGPEHPEVAAALSNLGIVALKGRRLGEARALTERALVIQRKLLGEHHPHVIFNQYNLASIASDEGRYDEARDLTQRVLEAQRATLKPDHPQIASTLLNLGILEFREGQYIAAQEAMEQALVIKEKSRGPDNIDLVNVLDNLGIVALARGNYQQACQWLERALVIKETSLGPEDPDLVETLLPLGRARLALDDFAEAVAVLERGLPMSTAAELEPGKLAMVRFTLARALWAAPVAAGRDRARARSLAEQALGAMADVESNESLHRSEIEAWLRRHR